ncbi:ferritin-like domain-containing protein [Catenuloplanes japonicus]|uniref:ferritin-like domain-containing protein n=1 Tax=Catenuloplanes japonicus TaxID=33876 RepID=UPI00052604FF|nr:ferritin-like domain-containing protein [Catenuloplanes japonicus]
MTVPPELAAALAGEEAAIFAYAPIGVRLTGNALVTQARDAEAAHRDLRDALLTRFAELSATPSPPAAGYTLPYPLTDQATALTLAIEIEERAAAIWRAALPPTTGTDRVLALSALTDSALRATRWRIAAKVTPTTVPFPGEQL